ncbi:ABC transporter ATP-binding protein [Hondaea fermentalgiana]|uniref:ABC transporter ATP-binding protein n=1 Tax=Hondaea fermentalgiana TaxID=2315210 RepID=A0A2R5G6U0_9STRA|nr:ABC transporter ATP-binding protein [Hondaea fermentalgiana]|eukprot:GBG26772.1 ABC transporter ATP-binding protein [Hondaea fermentalgiana]
MWYLAELYVAEARRLAGFDNSAWDYTDEARRILLTKVNETLVNDARPPSESVESGSDGGLVDVPVPRLLLSMTPLLLACAVSYILNLDLISQIFVSSVRTFVQLSIVGFILVPIFQAGAEHWYVVAGYVLFMCLLAAREGSARPKYSFRGQFLCVLAAILSNVVLVSLFAFAIIIRPTPVYDPQYVIPICGMLLGNCINGIALSLNALLTSFVEQQPEIELYLSFGATKYEACSRLLREAVRTGTMPTLNSMAVIGLISIPGMMTGQVLGGSPPQEAARYQMLIMYLIAICGFGSILSIDWVALLVAFDKDHRLRGERFTKRAGPRRSIFYTVRSCCSSMCNWWPTRVQGYKTVDPETTSNAGADTQTKVSDLTSPDPVDLAPNRIHVTVLNAAPNATKVLTVDRVNRSVPLEAGSKETRVLFADFGVTLRAGEIASVTGPSGAGKSQFLRLVAGLVPLDCGDLYLGDERRSAMRDMTVWRHKVRYVTQYKIDTPGTPTDFAAQISSLNVAKSTSGVPTADEVIAETRQLISAWGMSRSSVDKEWKELSGGEAQRVIVALAIASKPQVLLLDESTSALDLESKLRVEKSVESYAREHGAAVLWITHDDEQISRIESAMTSA